MTDEEKKYFKTFNCWMSGNEIRLGNLTNQRLIPEFIKSLKRLVFKFKHKDIILDFSQVSQVLPFPAVPIAAYIEYFRKEKGINFEFKGLSGYLIGSNFTNPKIPSKSNTDTFSAVLDKIWTFNNSDDVNLLVNGLKSSIRRTSSCEQGILDAIEWGLNEVMDNVIQHSGIKKGFIMGQVHKENNKLNICIFDYGIGIYKTLKNTKHKPANAVDAISLCVKEGVTRDKKVGQGNGLWGLYNMVTLNGGFLTIISGKGGLNFNQKDDKLYTYKDIILLNYNNQSTNVNFYLNLDKSISIKEALKGHEITDMYIENLENDYGLQVYNLFENSRGTGTREAAKEVKNEILNIIKQSNRPLTVDFKDIGIVSSSYADELIAKLIIKLGFYQFQNLIRLKGMNNNVESIVQRSIGMRFADTVNNKNK